ncbi:hypothetical protein HYC85_012029 [Camellia sinensis]|uniref:Uncharacterized protein n=1 Tax=Camellia sinensis TaxID=4442 RepID=A0A7J7HE11_CAMSI|nr:hypothetical protein HYC85_012029 [Camellia sinensis]
MTVIWEGRLDTLVDNDEASMSDITMLARMGHDGTLLYTRGPFEKAYNEDGDTNARRIC